MEELYGCRVAGAAGRPAAVADRPSERIGHLDESGRNSLRLNFSNASPERIEEGIRRLGKILKNLMLRAA